MHVSCAYRRIPTRALSITFAQTSICSTHVTPLSSHVRVSLFTLCCMRAMRKRIECMPALHTLDPCMRALLPAAVCSFVYSYMRTCTHAIEQHDVRAMARFTDAARSSAWLRTDRVRELQAFPRRAHARSVELPWPLEMVWCNIISSMVYVLHFGASGAFD